MFVHTFAFAMGIENEIQQSKFQCEYEKLLVNVMFTGGWVQNFHSELLKKFDLTVQQYNILRILRGQYPKPSTVNLLIERMLYKNSNASRLVDKLLAKGLVERKVCPSDRRKAEVRLNEAGIELLKESDVTALAMIENYRVINEDDVRIANEVLDKIRALDSTTLKKK